MVQLFQMIQLLVCTREFTCGQNSDFVLNWFPGFETKFEYIRPVWNMYLGGFEIEYVTTHSYSIVTLHYAECVSVSIDK